MREFRILILVLILLLIINNSSNKSLAKSLSDQPKDKKISLITEDNLKNNIKNHHLIAHAGGIVGKSTYTNSKDAMDLSYNNGIRLMEIDFEWTTDNKLVCIHSWNELVEELFNVPIRQYSYEEFNKLEMINGWQQLTPDILAKWLEDHSDAYLVTDIKRKSVDALKILSDSYPHLIERIIPQIYNFDQYDKVLDLGYKNIILTLYMTNNTDKEIIDFAREHKLFAITMPKKQAETSLPKKLNELGIYIYTHTMNDDELIEDYIGNGVSGFYTDVLLPEGEGIKKISQINRIYVKLNGKVLKFVSSINTKGNTFVPFRKLFESLGANVEWNEETQTAIGYADKIKIELFINKNYAIVNGKTVKLDAAPFIMKGNTMVPVRFVSETLGAKVDWDQKTSTVIITTQD